MKWIKVHLETPVHSNRRNPWRPRAPISITVTEGLRTSEWPSACCVLLYVPASIMTVHQTADLNYLGDKTNAVDKEFWNLLAFKGTTGSQERWLNRQRRSLPNLMSWVWSLNHRVERTTDFQMLSTGFHMHTVISVYPTSSPTPTKN